MDDISRRAILKGIAALGAGAAVAMLPGCSSSSSTKKSSTPLPGTSTTAPYPNTSLPQKLLGPGARPNPSLPEGTDTLPKIEHIVVLQMENHSFDDHFGMLGRGDGYLLDAQGKPLDANPDGKGGLVKAFHMPSTCQLKGVPGQDWLRSHTSWNNGRNDGFVLASTAVAMGYWDEHDIPFYYGLARTFPICDRFFCSTLAQTYPNRRFLLGGTAAGIVSTSIKALQDDGAPNGTIMDRLHAHDISWRNYYTDLPGTAVFTKTLADYPDKLVKIEEFYKDAAAGTLPAVSFVDPNFDSGSEENDGDIRIGEHFAAKVINAVMHGPAWNKTVLIYNYDEHGGYYDHVAPPPAIEPDDIKPGTDVPNITGAYDRYGFRVPAVVVSPFARRDYVSHQIFDQTSVLKFIETKWNLGALTYRDANANNMLDLLDLTGDGPFIEPPSLPEAGELGTCVGGKPGGPIPPPDAVVASATGLRVGAAA